MGQPLGPTCTLWYPICSWTVSAHSSGSLWCLIRISYASQTLPIISNWSEPKLLLLVTSNTKWLTLNGELLKAPFLVLSCLFYLQLTCPIPIFADYMQVSSRSQFFLDARIQRWTYCCSSQGRYIQEEPMRTWILLYGNGSNKDRSFLNNFRWLFWNLCMVPHHLSWC